MAEVSTKGLETWACLWQDAHQSSLEYERNEIIHRPMLYITTGILLKQDGDGMTFAMDVCETNTFRQTTFVPAKMILDRWKIGPLTPRRRKPTTPMSATAHAE